jgi:hypothetical protein
MKNMTPALPEVNVRKRWRPPWYAWLLAALVLLLLANAFFFLFYYQRFRMWDLESGISRSLPPGSTDAQVDAWLKAQTVPHTEMRHGEEEYALKFVPGPALDPDFAAISPENRARVILCRIYNAHPFLRIDIVIEFFFDEDGKLVSHVMRDEWEFTP